jgi:mannose-6-phosphate isomerase class I
MPNSNNVFRLEDFERSDDIKADSSPNAKPTKDIVELDHYGTNEKVLLSTEAETERK